MSRKGMFPNLINNAKLDKISARKGTKIPLSKGINFNGKLAGNQFKSTINCLIEVKADADIRSYLSCR